MIIIPHGSHWILYPLASPWESDSYPSKSIEMLSIVNFTVRVSTVPSVLFSDVLTYCSVFQAYYIVRQFCPVCYFVCGKCTSRTFAFIYSQTRSWYWASSETMTGPCSFDGQTTELINNQFVYSVDGMHFILNNTRGGNTYANIDMHINPVIMKTLKQALFTDGLSTPKQRASPCSSGVFLLFASTMFTAPDPSYSSVRTKLMWDNGPCRVSENAESDAFWH